MSHQFALAALLSALLAPALAASDPLRAGFGAAPLPAPLGGPLAGYGGLRDRRAAGVLDPPEARALLIERGGLRLALVALDLVIIRPSLHDAVREAAGDLALDGLLIAATHTHSGPGGHVPGWLAERVTAGSFDPDRPTALRDASVAALRRAHDDLDRAALGAASGGLDLAANRSDRDGRRETSLPVLRIDRPDGGPVAVVFAYGCHPVTLGPDNHLYSADLLGPARAHLDASIAPALFLAGPLGDQNPDLAPETLWPDDEMAMRAQQRAAGERLAAAVAAVHAEIEPHAEATLGFAERWAEAPPIRLRRFGLTWWFAPFTRPALRGLLSQRARFQAFHLGDARLVAFPAEISASLGDAARALADAPVTLAVSHANDWLGYAVDAHAYGRGGYEPALSFFGPGFGDWLLEQMDATLAGLER